MSPSRSHRPIRPSRSWKARSATSPVSSRSTRAPTAHKAMDSQHSELFAIVGTLQECARRGDWKNAFEAASALRDRTPPANTAETGQYLDRLRDALVVAKASRTHLAATL